MVQDFKMLQVGSSRRVALQFDLQVMFNSMDTDHDDVIAYSEFLAAALQGRIKVHEDHGL